jgi:hypothetical protein
MSARRRVQALASALFLGLPVAGPLYAQGVVSGLVLDELNHLAVTGVSVRIAELDRETVTDRTGRFQFVGIPGGSYTVTTRYLGYLPTSESVTVAEGRRENLILRIAPAPTQLGAVVVTATRTGQAAALNQQQNT